MLARTGDDPGHVLARLNDEICETATRGMFVTMAAGLYDPGDGSARISNAGHEPPLYRSRSGAFEAFPADAPPLGIVPGCEFPESRLSMAGGSLYLCSDGLTEAACATGEQLGRAGLERLIDRFASKPISERIEAIAGDLSECEVHDDLTLLGVSDEDSPRG